jgi:hypothetical protein
MQTDATYKKDTKSNKNEHSWILILLRMGTKLTCYELFGHAVAQITYYYVSCLSWTCLEKSVRTNGQPFV